MRIAFWGALFTALLIVVVLGPLFIPFLRRLRFGQPIRSDGPQRHLIKSGTPTMGGLLFLPGFLGAGLIWSRGSASFWLVFLSFIIFGLIGFSDDLLKVVWRRSLGLKARQKLIGQFAGALVILILASVLFKRGTDIIIPICGLHWNLGWLYYPVLATFIVGLVNAVNLTDGLDGLATGVSFLVFLGFLLICLAAVNNPPLPLVNYGDLAIAAAILAGCCLGFLVYNRYPAKLFMGDTGSLALGGILASFTVLTKTEIVFLLLGLVFVLEVGSVFLQVISFQLLGRRIFRMSPLHHHFEMIGWPEQKVVLLFWLLAAAGVVGALILVSI